MKNQIKKQLEDNWIFIAELLIIISALLFWTTTNKSTPEFWYNTIFIGIFSIMLKKKKK